MNIRKVLWVFVAALVLVSLSVSPASAQRRHGLQALSVKDETTNLSLPANTWVWGVTLTASSSSSWVSLHNAATAVAAVDDASGTRIAEIGEASQYDYVENWFPHPILCTNGLSIFVIGTAVVYYGPPVIR